MADEKNLEILRQRAEKSKEERKTSPDVRPDFRLPYNPDFRLPYNRGEIAHRGYSFYIQNYENVGLENLTEYEVKPIGRKAKLKLDILRAIPRGADLRKADLLAADLSGADLSGADLRKANLLAADLSGAILRGALLNGAILREVNLRGALLNGAILQEVNLRGALLNGATLWRADLSKADLREADLREGLLIGADLRGADLRGADLSKADLRKADLRGGLLIGADLRGAALWGADLRGADLRGADLREADLSGADLRGADLRGADLSGANLEGAVLKEPDVCESIAAESFDPESQEPTSKKVQASKESIQCSIFLPPSTTRGSDILIQAFIHLTEQLSEVRQLAADCDASSKLRGFRTLIGVIPIGTKLVLHLLMPRLSVEEPLQVLEWQGKAESIQFAVRVPPAIKSGNVIGEIRVLIDAIPIGKVKFLLKVVEAEISEDVKKPRLVEGEFKHYDKAFISYASEDRLEVLKRVQVLNLLKIEYFQDLLSLEPGERWEKTLYRYINESDLFLLFWSSAAKKSEWVMKEVSYAMQLKGFAGVLPPDIFPLIIEGPPPPPPPHGLEHLHFNDSLIYLMAGQQMADRLKDQNEQSEEDK